ncbi:MAG: alpha/beta fold hydrolase [Solirubrobacterales bacterium]|nr:alpha/beta fold hydrolase [Solirubrobacterales bacterium]
MVSHCPPTAGPLSDHVVPSALATWRAGVDGWATYATRALHRGATPVDVMHDVMRWMTVMADRRPPTWATPHEVVLETDVARLRDFTQGSTADVVPTLLVPPQAGHDSCIVDFSAGQSQVKAIRAAGLERLFSLDWIGATQATKDASIGEYVDAMRRAIGHIGEPVNLVGDCQGGWLAVIYAALYPEDVNTLTVAGAPIDFHAGEALIHAYVDTLSPGTDLRFYEAVVAMGDGVLKGEFMLKGFIGMSPENELSKQLQLLARLDDAVHVDRYRAFENWFKHTQDLPGAFYLWIVEHLFRDNQLVRGELVHDGRAVRLDAIACPLFLLAGERDHITPPRQVFAMADHVATPPEDVAKRITTGGHLGLFMGTEALRDHWPFLMAGVLEHSRRDPDAAAAAAAARRVTPARTPAIPAP